MLRRPKARSLEGEKLTHRPPVETSIPFRWRKKADLCCDRREARAEEDGHRPYDIFRFAFHEDLVLRVPRVVFFVKQLPPNPRSLLFSPRKNRHSPPNYLLHRVFGARLKGGALSWTRGASLALGQRAIVAAALAFQRAGEVGGSR